MSKPRRKRPDIAAMNEDEFEALLDKPRDCTGPCKRTLTYGRFPMTSERGKLVFRTWCQECMSSYYRSRAGRKRQLHQMKCLAKTGPVPVLKGT